MNVAIHFTPGDPCELTLAGNHLHTFTVDPADICYLIGAFKGKGHSCPITNPKTGATYRLHTDNTSIYTTRDAALVPGVKTAYGYLTPARRVAILKKLEKYWSKQQ